MAQPGSALVWGASGRRFKSGRPDVFFASVVLTLRYPAVLQDERSAGGFEQEEARSQN